MSTTGSIRSGLPPGPKGTLIVGNLQQFRVEFLNFLLGAALANMQARWIG